MSTAVAEPAPTWPSPDFLNKAQRLRHELETAIRLEQSLTQRIESIQDVAFKRGLPLSVIAGGPDELKKISDKQVAATDAVNDKREELRNFLNSERARFFAARDSAHERLRTEVSERFARAQKLAAELYDLLGDLFGTEAEAGREEKTIRQWNRAVAKLNKTIPSPNTNALPGAAGIGIGESIRARIEARILQDKNLRELCRDFLSREADKRERFAANEEVRIAQAEIDANPFLLLDKPF